MLSRSFHSRTCHQTPVVARPRRSAAHNRATEHSLVLDGAMVRRLLGMSFRERLEVVLHELGTKFGVRDKRGILLMPELAHADLADMIGSSRPMVSRLIADMAEEGLILRQGKQFVLLEPFAGEESDSADQLKDRRRSYPESSLPLGRPLFKRSVAEKNGRLPVSLSSSAQGWSQWIPHLSGAKPIESGAVDELAAIRGGFFYGRMPTYAASHKAPPETHGP